MARISTKNPLTIRELSRAEMPLLYPLTKSVNPGLTKAAFLRYLKEMQKNNYRCIGAFSGKKMVGACGIWVNSRFWCGQYMEVDNVVVDLSQRNNGIGKVMMEWVEREARRLKCSMVIADSYTHNSASHRFYFREGYYIKGFCFVKDL